jgi:DtxR family Mn-dependent transcriptional regulator
LDGGEGAALIAANRRFGLASLTVENYIKTIYQVCADNEGQTAATGQLALALAVSPGSVTSMLKTLSEEGLATYTPYGGVSLTDSGNTLALRVLRRHRLIELFLSKTLDLSWDEVHEEAEQMEHAASDRLIDRIDEFLGFPAVDPHGDPIPRSDGSVDHPVGTELAECAPGVEFRLSRVLDQSPDFLRYLTESKMALGAEGHVVANRREAGIITVAVAGEEQTLSLAAARKILVQPKER